MSNEIKTGDIAIQIKHISKDKCPVVKIIKIDKYVYHIHYNQTKTYNARISYFLKIKKVKNFCSLCPDRFKCLLTDDKRRYNKKVDFTKIKTDKNNP